MARFTPEHKDASREKLITAAARLFRQQGFNGVGINDLCAAAGLTRGAFYVHFTSKAALLTQVLAGAHDFVQRLRARTATTTAGLRKQAAQVACDYLEPENREAVVAGCSIASLALDAVRGEPAARQAYAHAVDAVVSEFQAAAPGEKRLSRDDARVALVICVGGLLLDNACGDDPEGAKIAMAAQREVRRLLQS